MPQVQSKYWNCEDRILTILKSYIDENGSLSDIRNKDLLLYQATQSRKRLEYYVEKLGYKIHEMNPPKKIKCRGHWRKWKNVKAAIEKVIQENNLTQFPSHNYLISKGIPSHAIANYDGINEVRERMGYDDTRLKAIDGHPCNSNMEKIVDDFFTLTGIKHTKEGKIQFCDKRCVADFILDDSEIVEVWGLDSDEYKERRQVKTEFYNRYFKDKLINIEIKDLTGSYMYITRNLKGIFSDYVSITITDEILMEQLFTGIKDDIGNLRVVLRPLLIEDEFIPSIPDINLYIEQGIVSKERGEFIKKLYTRIGSVEYIACKLGWKNKRQYYSSLGDGMSDEKKN